MHDIAIIGTGETTRTAVTTNLVRYCEGIEGGIRLLIPIGRNQSRAALWAAEWAQAHDHPYNVWIDSDSLDERQDSVVQSSVRESACDDATETLLRSLPRDSSVLIAWSEGEECLAVATEALARGAKVFDVTDMAEIVEEAEGQDEEQTLAPREAVVAQESAPDLASRIAKVVEEAEAEIIAMVRSHMADIYGTLNSSETLESIGQ